MVKKNLLEINPENYFWLRDGRILKNLIELHEALLSMDSEIFAHHVNEEKNDFHNWIKDILREERLAKQLLKAKTPEEAAKILSKKVRGKRSVKKNIIKTKDIPKGNNKSSKNFLLKRLKKFYYG